jgi:hypothetical protein
MGVGPGSEEDGTHSGEKHYPQYFRDLKVFAV